MHISPRSGTSPHPSPLHQVITEHRAQPPVLQSRVSLSSVYLSVNATFSVHTLTSTLCPKSVSLFSSLHQLVCSWFGPCVCVRVCVCACVCTCVCLCVCVCVCILSGSVVSDPLWPHKLQRARLLCPWSFLGKNTGLGCHFLLQGIYLIQGSNPCLLRLLHPHADPLPIAPPEKPQFGPCTQDKEYPSRMNGSRVISRPQEYATEPGVEEWAAKGEPFAKMTSEL